jgi:hypothetical protein
MPIVGVSWNAEQIGVCLILSLVVVLVGFMGATGVAVLRRMRSDVRLKPGKNYFLSKKWAIRNSRLFSLEHGC